MDGILLIDKPKGPTSHDVVAVLRRLLGMKQIGHAGTLDPQATGLLVMLLGKATKLSSYLSDSTKRYEACFELGVTTDTYDDSGQVVECKPVTTSFDEVTLALKKFVGNISQRPPMFSAVKVRGKKLYEYARAGKSIETPPRDVTIFDLCLKSFQGKIGAIDMTCSSGTYVRSLVHDLGQYLKTGAITTQIRRIESGCFSITQALSLDDLKNDNDPKSYLCSKLFSIEQAWQEKPCVCVDDLLKSRIKHGGGVSPVRIRNNQWRVFPSTLLDPILVIDEGGDALGLGCWDVQFGLKMKRVF